MRILITGSAGFIGFHLAKKLLENKKYKIFGLDNLNNYYSVNLKKNRLNLPICEKPNKIKIHSIVFPIDSSLLIGIILVIISFDKLWLVAINLER